MNKLALEIEAVNRIKAELAQAGELDPDLKSDMIEGNTDFTEIITYLVGKVKDEETLWEAIGMRIADLQKRKKAAENRASKLRDVILQAMQAVGERSLRLAEATVSVGFRAGKPTVVNAEQLPDDCVRVKREADMVAIKKAVDEGRTILGIVIDNGSEYLTIRT